jgi:sterol 3beta-glucosyltransferase
MEARMHTTIVTVGTRGDVQPYLALGLGLKDAGFRVRLATQSIYAPLIQSHGLEFAVISGDPRATMERQSGQDWQRSGRNLFALAKSMREVFAGENLIRAFDDTLAACQGTDAILYAFFGTAGYHVARKLDIPSVFTLLQPFSRSHEAPSLGFPKLPLGRIYNWLTHLATEQMLWRLGGPALNRWRQDRLGLPRFPGRGLSPRSTVKASLSCMVSAIMWCRVRWIGRRITSSAATGSWAPIRNGNRLSPCSASWTNDPDPLRSVSEA